MSKRTDANQQTIINCFRRIGYTVKDMSAVGGGFPDLIVSKGGTNDLIEIKTDTGKLNELQLNFIAGWNSPVYVVRCIDDVLLFNEGNLKPVAVKYFAFETIKPNRERYIE